MIRKLKSKKVVWSKVTVHSTGDEKHPLQLKSNPINAVMELCTQTTHFIRVKCKKENYYEYIPFKSSSKKEALKYYNNYKG